MSVCFIYRYEYSSLEGKKIFSFLKYKLILAKKRSYNFMSRHASETVLSVEEFKAKKAIEDAQTKRLERQASAERQKVYEDVFLEEMQHYIQYGATESMFILC